MLSFVSTCTRHGCHADHGVGWGCYRSCQLALAMDATLTMGWGGVGMLTFVSTCTRHGCHADRDRSPHGPPGTRAHGHTGTRPIQGHTGTRGIHGHTGTRAQCLSIRKSPSKFLQGKFLQGRRLQAHNVYQINVYKSNMIVVVVV